MTSGTESAAALRFLIFPLFVLALFLTGFDLAMAQDAPGTSSNGAQPLNGRVPGDALGNTSDAELWRQVRQGAQGTVSIPDAKAGVLVQSEGDNWRAVRNGPLSTYGAWLMLGMVIFLALFFALRGRIKVEAGLSGRKILRFDLVERFCHWLTAISFIVLAITGLNMLYGRYLLLPIMGKEAFSTLAWLGKYAHDFVAFGFMAGLALIFVLWVVHNIPNKYDLIWLSKAGGLFSKHSHPPSKKFNAGQKIIFWVTILGGVSLSLSGWMLLDPFQWRAFSGTFEFLNVFGFGLPTDLTLLQEQQLAHIWHSIVGLIMIAVILAHIYIGSIGMQGAFDAMGTGKVDVNWAREHHNLWVDEVEEKERAAASKAPAE